jgi:hypothetical protein
MSKWFSIGIKDNNQSSYLPRIILVSLFNHQSPREEVWHDKDPSLLKGPERQA